MSESTIGLLACFCTVILWTIGTFSFTQASRLASATTLNRVRLLYALIAISIITCIVEGIAPWDLFLAPTADQFLWFGLSGLVGFTIGDSLGFHGFKILGGRRASVYTSVAPAAALVFGMFLLDEHVSAIGMLGMAISVAGILMLSNSKHEQKEVHEEGHGNFFLGVLVAVLGAACQGIGLVLSKKGFGDAVHTISAFHATWIRLSVATVAAYASGMLHIPLWQELRRVSSDSKLLKPIIVGTIVGPVLGVTASLLGVSKIEASVAQTILALTPVSVTLVSVVYYKERIRPISVLAVAISLCGVFILVWRNAL